MLLNSLYYKIIGLIVDYPELPELHIAQALLKKRNRIAEIPVRSVFHNFEKAGGILHLFNAFQNRFVAISIFLIHGKTAYQNIFIKNFIFFQLRFHPLLFI